jgi:TRAP-type C4-dicarboxylate transport system substrate-binding protein
MILVLLLLSVPQGAQALRLKLATIAPEGSPWMAVMRSGAAEIKQRTAGRVELKFYGGGVMGNEMSVLRKIRAGQLHGGAFSSTALTEVYPDLRLRALPMVLRDYADYDAMAAALDGMFRQGLEDAGFVNFGFAEAGISLPMGSVPVRTLEDLNGQKMWVPEGDTVSYAIMQALGLAPIPLPLTDVMTGLQTGLINVIGGSASGAIAFQWHTEVKYISRVPLAFLFSAMVIDRKMFQQLQPVDQVVVREVMERIYRDFNQGARLDNEAAFTALVRQGLVVVEPPADEIARWRERAWRVIGQMADRGDFSRDLYLQLKLTLKQTETASTRTGP